MRRFQVIIAITLLALLVLPCPSLGFSRGFLPPACQPAFTSRRARNPAGDDVDNLVDEMDNILVMNRREALLLGRASVAGMVFLTQLIASEASAADTDDSIAKNKNPSPNSFPLQGTADVTMPLIAYSFYKTAPELAPRGLALALRAGVRHFDMATDYGNFNAISPLLKQYFSKSKVNWFEEEKEDLLETLDGVREKSDAAYKNTDSKKNKKIGKQQQRRNDVFLTYKLSNSEQSTDSAEIRRAITKLLKELGTSYLDMVSLHSPLTDSTRRLATYQALLQLKDEGLIRSVGVCNYGICHLKEIAEKGFPLPSMNQIEVSPFNNHDQIVQFCKQNNILVGCASWSRLSSVDGPVEQWEKLGNLAKVKGVTKAQILVRWALQKGYACAPRSGTKSKLERFAISENSYGGVLDFQLSEEDIALLDGLNVDYKCGKLGRRDGWKDEDVTGPEWEPTAC